MLAEKLNAILLRNILVYSLMETVGNVTRKALPSHKDGAGDLIKNNFGMLK